MEVVVPDIGDFDDVEVIEVLVKSGDAVEKESPLITLETEKAAMDVPSPAAGEVGELKVSVGDRVSAGDVILTLQQAEDDAEGAEPEAAAREPGAGSGTAAGDAGGANDASGAGDAAGEDGAAAGGDTAAGETAGEAAAAGDDAAPDDAREPQPVTVPDLGDFDEVDVIDVLVGEGDAVEAEQGLITLETEKASMDVPAPMAGTVVEIKVRAGDKIKAGGEILTLRPAGAAAGTKRPAGGEAEAAGGAAAGAEPPVPPRAPAGAKETAASQPRADAAPATAEPSARVDEAGFSRAHASPSVRKLARELGVDLGRVRGSGRKGRIRAEDLKSFVKDVMQRGARGGALPSVPEVDFAKFGEIELQPLTRIQRVAGPRLHASWVNIPHVTQHDEADITDLEDTRQSLKEQAAERGIRLTPLAFIIRACVLTLDEFPRFKSSLAPDGRNVVMKHYTHVGFAADTPNGLVVPVIRDAERKDVYELARMLGQLSERARDGKLKIDEMQGGVFSVSSLGGIGGTFFTPVVNAPEVAILGVSKSQWKPVYENGQFVPRLILPLSLSYDHRVIDGAAAVRFTTRLAQNLSEVERLLEAIP